MWRHEVLGQGSRRQSPRLCGLLCEVSLRATSPVAAAPVMLLGVAEKEGFRGNAARAFGGPHIDGGTSRCLRGGAARRGGRAWREEGLGGRRAERREGVEKGVAGVRPGGVLAALTA